MHFQYQVNDAKTEDRRHGCRDNFLDRRLLITTSDCPFDILKRFLINHFPVKYTNTQIHGNRIIVKSNENEMER